MSDYNLGALKNRVKKLLQVDPFYSDEDVVEAINRGIDDINLFARYTREKDVTQSIAGAQEYALPDDFMVLHAVTFDGGMPLKEMTLDEWIEANNATILFGTPRKYMVRNNQFFTFDRPPDRVAEIRIFYTAKTPDLVNDTENVPIKREFSDCIVNYAAYWLLQDDNRGVEAEAAFNKYLVARAKAGFQLNMNSKRKVKRVTPTF